MRDIRDASAAVTSVMSRFSDHHHHCSDHRWRSQLWFWRSVTCSLEALSLSGTVSPRVASWKYNHDDHHHHNSDYNYQHNNHHSFDNLHHDHQGQNLSDWGRVKLDLKASSTSGFHTLKKVMMIMMTTMIMMMMMRSMLTSRSGKESTVELFLDELAELEPAKVAPELKIIVI